MSSVKRPNGRAKSLIGQTFGLLTVLRRAGFAGRNPTWWCKCSCGEEVEVRGDRLKNGQRKACARNGHFWVGSQPPGLARLHPVEYNTWQRIRERCTNSNCAGWEYYGGRGIKVCERWNSFKNFFEDMGPKPSGKHSIDRYSDVNGNYEPANCRWATLSQQRRNCRDNFYVEYEGERLLLVELIERRGLNYSLVKGRIRNGWSLEAAMLTPLRAKTERVETKPRKPRIPRPDYAPTVPLHWPEGYEVGPKFYHE